MARDDVWTPDWSCEKLISHSDVLAVQTVSENLIQLTIKDHDTNVYVATMSKRTVTLADLPASCRNERVEFLLNIPKDALIEGDVIDFTSHASIGIGSLGDLYTAINEKEFRSYIPKEVRFILRGLRQHTAVSRIDRLNNRTYLVHRHLRNPVRVLALDDYDLTADAVRDGLDKFGRCDIVLTSNPNCRPSPESVEAARHSGVRVLQWAQLLGALNH